MFTRLITLFFAGCLIGCGTARQPGTSNSNNEQHRLQAHFTPAAKWINDPNGMVYFNNTYHLFYQYYPDSTVWGPMHWGHATSDDLYHWKHEPVALYPDSLGYIFSGSAVADVNNTSGLGTNGQVPLVAIFTHHDTAGDKAGRIDYQNQSIAYSTDNGKTWTKYAGNPVLRNPGIRDYRDPKVAWHDETKKWIMTLATLDRITFYSSPDLKNWSKESEFGKDVGAHGGVWECPDLFSLQHEGKKVWVLLVSINPGAPNGGSATQYFTGDFDGKTFSAYDTVTRWIDYGPDNYAGVTWSNTGDRKIFLGWMNNWQYANLVPTVKWRGAMTLPRDLSIRKINDAYILSSQLSPEIQQHAKEGFRVSEITASKYDITSRAGKLQGPVRLDLSSSSKDDFSVTLSNTSGQSVVIGFNKETNEYYIDRTASGKIDFEKGFARRHLAPAISNTGNVDVTLFIDNSSVELFADGGTTVMTALFFPDEDYSKVELDSKAGMRFSEVKLTPYKSMYE